MQGTSRDYGMLGKHEVVQLLYNPFAKTSVNSEVVDVVIIHVFHFQLD